MYIIELSKFIPKATKSASLILSFTKAYITNAKDTKKTPKLSIKKRKLQII